MNFCVALLIGALGIGIALVLAYSTENRDAKRIVKTKLLSQNSEYYHRRSIGGSVTRTTFMVYYEDNTHIAKTVRNGTHEYDLLMGKLEE